MASDKKEDSVLQRVKQMLDLEKKQNSENFEKHFNKAESEYEKVHLLKGYSKKML